METYESFRATDGFFYIIYKIVNKLDGKFYIGMHRTKNIGDGYMGSGLRLKYAQEKYGLENFEKQYLHFYNTVGEMVNKEIELVNEELISRDDCYNIRLGGEGGWWDTNLASSAAKKQWQRRQRDSEYDQSIKSKRMRTINSADYDKQAINKSISDAVNATYSNGRVGTFRGKQHTDESKLRIGRANSQYTGSKNFHFGTCWIFNNECSIKIRKSELELYIAKGWVKGRKMFKSTRK